MSILRELSEEAERRWKKAINWVVSVDRLQDGTMQYEAYIVVYTDQGYMEEKRRDSNYEGAINAAAANLLERIRALKDP